MKKFEKDQKTKIFEDIGKQKTISYEDFNTEETEEKNNLKLQIGFMKNKLIPESTYLDENKDKLITVFEKLSTFDEKNIYLDKKNLLKNLNYVKKKVHLTHNQY